MFRTKHSVQRALGLEIYRPNAHLFLNPKKSLFTYYEHSCFIIYTVCGQTKVAVANEVAVLPTARVIPRAFAHGGGKQLAT